MSTTAPASVTELDFTPKHDVFPSPIDWRDQVMYQVLLDRFDNNADDIPSYDPKTAKRGRDPQEGRIFQGGNLRGLTRRLDYIKGMGFTTVWITPPFKQRLDEPGSYHGYAFQDLLDIDPRFGAVEDLRNLVVEAHARGMYVILDIVLNHAGNVFEYEDGDPPPFDPNVRHPFKQWRRYNQNGEQLTRDDAVWPVELQNPDAFKRHGAIRDMSSADITEKVDGDFFSLKDLDVKNPVVADTLIKAFKYWIAVADIDGFRIDTVGHVEPGYMALFCNAISEYTQSIGKRNFLTFGEIVSGDDELHKYIGNNGPSAGTEGWFPRLGAVLDFPLYTVLDEVIKGHGQCNTLRDRIEHFRQYYRDQGEAAKYYITFIDNHDQSHRPYRRFMNGVENWRVAVQGATYLLLSLGIPCIYYGTEQGFNGSGDSDAYVREAMFGGKWGAFDSVGQHFFDPENPIYKGIAKVTTIRRDEPALRWGRQYFREVADDGKNFGYCETGFLAFSRVLDNTEILVVMNLSDNPRNTHVICGAKLTPAGGIMTDLLNERDNFPIVSPSDGVVAVKVEMAPRQTRILKCK